MSTLLAGIACLALGGPLLLPATAGAASADQAVAYQLDPAHDGYQTSSPITTPLSQAWSVSLSGAISYPLIVNGVVYVTAVNPSGGTTLYALEQATGATLWSHALGGSSPWSDLTYDAGQVFTVNADGLLTAFDATTGATDWSVGLPGQTSFSSPPTASNGLVYTGGAGSGGTVYAVGESSGQVVWSQSVLNGDNSSPAVDASGVYVTYACDQDYAFNPLTGGLIWHHSTACEGGGGKTPVLANGDVFGRDSVSGNVILSTASGATQGSFSSTPAPAVGSGAAYTVGGGTLTAVASSGTGSNIWTFAGDGKLDTAPLIVGSLVFEASSGGNVYAVATSTGASTWSTTLPAAAPAPDEQNLSQPLTGLGAGEDTLIVPTGSTLTAYAGANVGTGIPSNSTAPSVVGAPKVGQPVGADVGTWTGLPTSYSYQWIDCAPGGTCSNISGATGESYSPTGQQNGTSLEVSVTATNASGTSSAVVSQPSSAIDEPPSDTAAPTISGSATAGSVLSATTGSWNPVPSSYEYQWLRCVGSTCSTVSGASSSSYTVTGADVGSQLEVQVTASNSAGGTTATSQPTSTVSLIPTVIALTSSANPASVGNQVTFTAAVSPNVDGGTITFSDGGQPLSWCQALPVNSASSVATCTGTALNAGTDLIQASYSGDAAYGASSASLTETIVNGPVTPAVAPPSVKIQGAPAGDSTSPAVYYQEGGSVTWTLCTIDGTSTPCDTTHAVLARLGEGSHTLVVQVIGGGGSAHDSVTWTVHASPAGGPSRSNALTSRLAAPRNLHARRTRSGVSLSWSSVTGARSYVLTATVGRHAHTYRLRASTRSFSLRMSRRQHGSVSLGAVAATGRIGAIASLPIT